MTRTSGAKGDVDSSVPAIYRELRDRVCLLVYPPGTLLSENKLAGEFGVSRSPIRRVLQRLEYDGLVVGKHGVGTQVTSVDLKYLRQVFALRLKLTDLIAEMPPAHVGECDVAFLDELLAQLRDMRERRNPVALGRIYLRFNEGLSRAIGNEPLREITDRLFYQTSRVWLQVLPEMDWEAEVGYGCDEIAGVSQGLRHGDMAAVASIRRRHLVMCLQRLNDYLGNLDTALGTAPRGSYGG